MPSKKNCQPPRRSSRLSGLNGVHVSINENKKEVRKRKASPDEKTKEKHMQKKSKDGREIDSHCWICHKLGQDEICSTCPRVYHSSCLNKLNQFSQEGACSECQLESLDGTKLSKFLTCTKLKQLLTYAAEKVFAPKFKQPAFLAWPELPENDKLFHIMDLEILIVKLNNHVPYTKTAEFYSDVKWIHHNCCILFGTKSSKSQAAARLLRNLKLELQDIEACPQCYYIKHSEQIFSNFFIKICGEPHTLLWAKLKGFPYWPAKCLKVINGMADVRFFGTHDRSRIPVNKCYLMSRTPPTEKSAKQGKYLAAVEELKDYIANYERKYGTFRYAPLRTVFCPESVLQERKVKKAKTNRSSAVAFVRSEATSDVLSTEAITSKSPPSNPNFIGISRQSAVTPPDNAVSICMTFTADDEGNNENLSSHDQLNSSQLHHSEPLITSLPIVTALHSVSESEMSEPSVPEILSNSSEMSTDNESDDCENKLGISINAVSSSDGFIISSELSTMANAGSQLNLPSEGENAVLACPTEECHASELVNDEVMSCNAIQVIENNTQRKAVPEVIVIDDDDEDDIMIYDSLSGSSLQSQADKNRRISEELFESMALKDEELYNFVMEGKLSFDGFYFRLWSVFNTYNKSAHSSSQYNEMQELENQVFTILRKNNVLRNELVSINMAMEEASKPVDLFENLKSSIESENSKRQIAEEENVRILSAQKTLEADYNAKMEECEQLKKTLFNVLEEHSVLKNELNVKKDKYSQSVQTNLKHTEIIEKKSVEGSIKKQVNSQRSNSKPKKKETITKAKQIDWERPRKRQKTCRASCEKPAVLPVSSSSIEVPSSSNSHHIPNVSYTNVTQHLLKKSLNINNTSENVSASQFNNMFVNQGSPPIIQPILFAQPHPFLPQTIPNLVGQHPALLPSSLLNARNAVPFMPHDLLSQMSERSAK